MLFKPSPRPPLAYGEDALHCHAEAAGYSAHRDALAEQQTNLSDLSLGQFRSARPLPSDGSPVPVPISHILAWRRPPQICRAIIAGIAIGMRDFVLRRGRRPVKSGTDKTAYREGFGLAAAREPNPPVSFFVHPSPQHVSRREHLAPAYHGRRPSDAPEIADLIIWPAFHRAPFFCRGIVSHIALHCRAVWLGASVRYAVGFWPRHLSMIFFLEGPFSSRPIFYVPGRAGL